MPVVLLKGPVSLSAGMMNVKVPLVRRGWVALSDGSDWGKMPPSHWPQERTQRVPRTEPCTPSVGSARCPGATHSSMFVCTCIWKIPLLQPFPCSDPRVRSARFSAEKNVPPTALDAPGHTRAGQPRNPRSPPRGFSTSESRGRCFHSVHIGDSEQSDRNCQPVTVRNCHL